MSMTRTILLEEIIGSRIGSVDPSAFPDEEFDLYSIPAFDSGEPEVQKGNEIGSTKQTIQSGDVLLSKIVPHIRRSWVVGENRGRRQIGSGEWIVFRSPHIHPPYLRHLLVADSFHREFMLTVSGVGGSLLRARPAQVAKIRIPLPPLPEQRRIAAILDQAEALRAKRRAALARLDTLAQSIFMELFEPGSPNASPFQKVRLGEVTQSITKGTTPSTLGFGYEDKGVPLLRVQNLVNGMVSVSSGTLFISNETNNALSRSKIKPNDVLVSIAGTIGRVALVRPDAQEMNCNQAIGIVRPSPDRVNPIFLANFLCGRDAQRQMKSAGVTGTITNLSLSQLRDLELELPPLSKQRTFSRIVCLVNAQRHKHSMAVQKVDSLFSALQHRAFRGEL